MPLHELPDKSKGRIVQMSVIEFAAKRLNEEVACPDNGDALYWAAYLDGARAQKQEDAQRGAKDEASGEGGRR